MKGFLVLSAQERCCEVSNYDAEVDRENRRFGEEWLD